MNHDNNDFKTWLAKIVLGLLVIAMIYAAIFHNGLSIFTDR